MTADTAQTETLHETRLETSLAVWDIAPTVAAGERFSVKAGAKSSAGCALGRLPHRGAGRRCCRGLRFSRRCALARHRRALLGRARVARAADPGDCYVFGALRRGRSRRAAPGCLVAVQRVGRRAARPHVDREGCLGRHADRGGLHPPRALSRDHRRDPGRPRSNWRRAATSLWSGRRDTTRSRCRSRSTRTPPSMSRRGRCRRTIPTRSGRRERRDIGASLSNRNFAP